MADLFVVNLKFFDLWIRAPLWNPKWEFMTFDLSELKDVRDSDSAKETVSTDLSLLFFLKLINLSGHRPATSLILFL